MLSARDITSLYDQSFDYFNKHWSQGQENERYRSVNHFTDAEKAQIESQDRVAYSIGLIANKVDQHLQHQRKNRTEWKLEAVNDANDEIKAEVGNIQFRDLEFRNNMIYTESDVYDSGVAVRYGVAGIYLDYDKDLNPVPSVREIDYRNFMWDANSIKYDKSDCMWMVEFDKVTRLQIKEEYGARKAKDLRQDEYRYGRPKDYFYVVRDKDGQNDNDIITKFTHYQKVLRENYLVLFNDYMNLHGLKGQVVVDKFKNKKDAERKLRELKLPYLLQNYPLQKNDVVLERKMGYDKYVLTYDKILEHEETDLEDFPYSVYHSYYYKGNFWTLTDVLKSAQQWIDRYIQQIDYSLGSDIKQAYEIVASQLADGFTVEEAIKNLQSDGYILTKAPGAVKQLRGTGVNPQWIQMVQVMQSYLEDLAGGRSFQGLQDAADESGKAIALKQKQGEGISSLFIDNLRRWKRDLGTKLLWWFRKYDTAERVIKIGGSQMGEKMLGMLQQMGVYTPSQTSRGTGYLKVNTPLTHLKDAEFELKVIESQLSESAREKKLGQLALLAQMNPELPQLPKFQEMFMGASGVDYTDKIELIEEYKKMKQAQAEMMAKQAEDEAQSKAVEDAVKVAELKLKERELGIKKNDSDNRSKGKSSGSSKK